jgi:hypothetical protein
LNALALPLSLGPDVGDVDKLKPEQASLFSYRTGVSLRAAGQRSRGWITWLLLVGSALTASGLVLGLLYWLVAFDAEALVTSLRQLLILAFSAH